MDFGNIENYSKYIQDAHDARLYFQTREKALSLVYKSIEEQSQQNKNTAQVLKKFTTLLNHSIICYNHLRDPTWSPKQTEDDAKETLSDSAKDTFQEKNVTSLKRPITNIDNVSKLRESHSITSADNKRGIHPQTKSTCSTITEGETAHDFYRRQSHISRRQSHFSRAPLRRESTVPRFQHQKSRDMPITTQNEPRKRLTFNRDYPKPWLMPAPPLQRPAVLPAKSMSKANTQPNNLRRASLQGSGRRQSVAQISSRHQPLRRQSVAPRMIGMLPTDRDKQQRQHSLHTSISKPRNINRVSAIQPETLRRSSSSAPLRPQAHPSTSRSNWSTPRTRQPVPPSSVATRIVLPSESTEDQATTMPVPNTNAQNISSNRFRNMSNGISKMSARPKTFGGTCNDMSRNKLQTPNSIRYQADASRRQPTTTGVHQNLRNLKSADRLHRTSVIRRRVSLLIPSSRSVSNSETRQSLSLANAKNLRRTSGSRMSMHMNLTDR